MVTTYGEPLYYPQYWALGDGWDSLFVTRDKDDSGYGHSAHYSRDIEKVKAKIDEYRTRALKDIEDQFNVVTTFIKHP